ncbi:MAG: twin-arginine translocase TatA/TatE family subunit [Bacteroidota bacterium]
MTSMLLMGLNIWQGVLIIAVVLLLFGGKKIPELMKGLGTGIREFKDAMNTPQDSEKDKKPDQAEEKK